MSAEFEKTVLKELKNINEKFDAINKRFDIADRQFDLIGAKFDEVDTKIEKNTSLLEDLCHSFAILEEKTSRDITALFDGYSMQHQILESQRKELYPLINKVDNLDIRISILEQKAVQ